MVLGTKQGRKCAKFDFEIWIYVYGSMINKNPIIEMLAKKSKVTSENFEFGYNSVTEEVGIFADNNKSFHNAFVGGKENLFLKSGKVFCLVILHFLTIFKMLFFSV